MRRALKKIIVVITFILASFFVVNQSTDQVYADTSYPACACSNPTENIILNNCTTASGKLGYCDNGENGEGVYYVLHIIMDIMIILVPIAGVIGISICGIVILTSKDDANRVAKGKARLREVVIGLVIFFSLYGIMSLLMPTYGQDEPDIGGMNTPDPERPTQPSSPTTNPSGGSGSGNPGSGSSNPSGGSGGTVNGWNTLCGPNPTQSIDRAKFGERTEIYTNNYGRTFYTFRQGDTVWADKRAGSVGGDPANGAGTMARRGCFRTSMAVMFNSFGLTDFTPANLSTSGELDWSSAVSMYPSSKNYFNYEVLYTGSRSSWKTKIINTFKAGGAAILRADGGYFPSTSTSMHSMPFVDYRSSNGKDEIYTFNTHSNKMGWYDLDTIVNNGVIADGLKASIDEIILITPKDASLNCASYRH